MIIFQPPSTSSHGYFLLRFAVQNCFLNGILIFEIIFRLHYCTFEVMQNKLQLSLSQIHQI